MTRADKLRQSEDEVIAAMICSAINAPFCHNCPFLYDDVDLKEHKLELKCGIVEWLKEELNDQGGQDPEHG